MTTRREQRLARLESGIPRRPRPPEPETWLAYSTVPELEELERICLRHDGRLPANDPVVLGLVAAARARMVADHAPH